MQTRKQNEEVVFAEDAVRAISRADVMEAVRKAVANPSGKFRICLHRSPDDALHEMLIAMRKDVKYPAHSHPGKEESYFLLEGRIRFFLFDAAGKQTDEIPLGDSGSGLPSYLRLPAGVVHRFDIESEVCAFLETKLGPFSPDDNKFSPGDFSGLEQLEKEKA